MPNTLAHMGVQGLVTRAAIRRADLKWVYVGCVIPDVPWILQRAVKLLTTGFDPFHVLLYATVQASLLFCLLLAAALAAFAADARRVFAILGLNAALHLLLDAAEAKWASGVHFLAPFNWHAASFGLFPLEGAVVWGLTALGVVVYVATFRGSVAAGMRLRVSRKRLLAGGGAIAAYLLVPFLLLGGPARVDSAFVRTLREKADRPGRYVEFDRAVYTPGPAGGTLRIFTGEDLAVEDMSYDQPTAVSVRAKFVAEDRIHVLEHRPNSNRARDLASETALGLIALLWTAAWIRRKRGQT